MSTTIKRPNPHDENPVGNLAICGACGYEGWYEATKRGPRWQGTLLRVGVVMVEAQHMKRTGERFVREIPITVYAHDRRVGCPTSLRNAPSDINKPTE